MSLVNEMLRDLDQRKRKLTVDLPTHYRMASREASSRGHWKILSMLGIGVIAGIVGAYLYLNQRQFAPPPSLPLAEQKSPATSVSSPASQDQIVRTEEPVTENVSGIGIRVAGLVTSESGFSLEIASLNPFDFEIVSQNDYGAIVLLQGVRNILANDVNMPGLSLQIVPAGIEVVFELNDPVQFQVHKKDSMAMTLVIEGTWEGAGEAQEISSTNDAPLEASGEPDNVAASAVVSDSSSNVRETSAVKTPRELSFQERDRNISSQAALQIQRGQLMEAYRSLLEFLDENPEAHQSRVTLAKLLFAQQEYAQAESVVDQGLTIALNYAAYKKIKARLMMMQGQLNETVELLVQLPPTLATDTEYYELLASAYQKAGTHSRAIEVYQDLIRYDRQQGRWWAGMGISHEALGNVDDAISSYQAALQTNKLESSLRQYSQNRVRFLSN